MRPYLRRYFAALVLISGLAAAGRATADEHTTIELARERWFDADFEAARDAFVAVLARPDLTAAQALDAHRYLAVLFVVLGDEAASRGHADAAVALDADVTPPEGSPRVAEDLFRMALRRVGGAAAITIASAGSFALGERGEVVARIEPSPPLLVDRMRLRCGADEATNDGATVTIPLEPTGLVVCTAEALSIGGAVLFAKTTELVPFGLGRIDGGQPARRRRAWPWVAASIAVAAGATTILVVRRDPRDVGFGGTTVVGW